MSEIGTCKHVRPVSGDTTGARQCSECGVWDKPFAPVDADYEQGYRDGTSSGCADWVIAFDEYTDIEFPQHIDMWSPTEVAQWLDAEIKRNQ